MSKPIHASDLPHSALCSMYGEIGRHRDRNAVAAIDDGWPLSRGHIIHAAIRNAIMRDGVTATLCAADMELVEDAVAYLSNEIYNSPPFPDAPLCEHTIQSGYLTGTVDVLCIGRHAADLIDWKTGSHLRYPDVEDDLQMLAYVHLVMGMYTTLTSITIHRIHLEDDDQTGVLTMCRGDVRIAYERKVLPVIGRIQQSPRFCKVRSVCDQCTIRASCPAWIDETSTAWGLPADFDDPADLALFCKLEPWLEGLVKKGKAAKRAAIERGDRIVCGDEVLVGKVSARRKITDANKAISILDRLGVIRPARTLSLGAIQDAVAASGLDAKKTMQMLINEGAIEAKESGMRYSWRTDPQAWEEK